jgi:hypothetical protein
LRELIYRGDRFVLVKGVDRGALLLHSRDEWTKRSVRSIKRTFRNTMIVILAFTAIPELFLFSLLGITIGIQASIPALLAIQLVLLMVMGVLGLMMWIAVVGCRKRNKQGLPVPGLYENGFERVSMSPWRSVFVPYTEVGKVRESKSFWWKTHDIYDNDGRLIEEMMLHFTGQEGFSLLLMRTRKEDEEEEEDPPALVVYGRRWRPFGRKEGRDLE